LLVSIFTYGWRDLRYFLASGVAGVFDGDVIFPFGVTGVDFVDARLNVRRAASWRVLRIGLDWEGLSVQIVGEVIRRPAPFGRKDALTSTILKDIVAVEYLYVDVRDARVCEMM
jgi:hypothetical protein